VYVVVGVLARFFSLVDAAYFLIDIGDQLPDMQEIINAMFGTIEE